jgi:hypothetical protein
MAFALAFVFVAAAIAAISLDNRTSSLQDSPARSSSIQLRATDMNGQLLITWNQLAPLVLESERAVLHISDGSDQADVDLDRDGVTKGSVTYVRRSGRVSLRLTVYRQGGHVDEVLSFVGEPVSRDESGVRGQDQAATETGHLQRRIAADTVQREDQ